jgi:hypothetical protein
MRCRRHYIDPEAYRTDELRELAEWLAQHDVVRCRPAACAPTTLLWPRSDENARLNIAVARYWQQEERWLARHAQRFPYRTWWRSSAAPAA